MFSIAGFLVCCIVIFLTGRKLSFYGDVIAEITGMGKTWVGFILLATVTSLPELFVGYSSASIVKSADMTVGSIFGSCAVNLGILAAMDAFVPGRKVLFSKASSGNIIIAGMGIILVALAGIALMLPYNFSLTNNFGAINLFFIAVFILAMRLIFKYQEGKAKHVGKEEEEEKREDISLSKAIFKFIIYALIIIAAALVVPTFVDEIEEMTGMGKSFAGTLFLAVSTSLPEIAISLAAVRAGSVDLVVGNLLGSNVFNIFVLAINDIFYSNGVLLEDASPNNIISVISVIIMSCIAIIGLIYKFNKKPLGMAYDSILIFLIYIINMLLLYNMENIKII